MEREYAVPYPRYSVRRFVMRWLGRFLLLILTRTKVTGREHFPKSGPLILVGNHVAFIEIGLMAACVPWNIEFVGTGDIPLDPRFAFTEILWGGYLHVNRGSTDRREISRALDVLKQGGIIAIFPEGGIWSTSMKQARTGVAWLSYRSGVPVMPVGFGGMRGAIKAMLRFQRPHLQMNVGDLLPPVDPQLAGTSRKQALEDAANRIMESVAALIPAGEKADWERITDEAFDFELVLGDAIQPLDHADGLGRFFHQPVILDVMARNFDLPVQPLLHVNEQDDPKVLTDALDVALGHLDTHPQFLNYRFGYEVGTEIHAGIIELRDALRQAETASQPVRLTPIWRYHDNERDQDIVLTQPGIMHEM